MSTTDYLIVEMTIIYALLTIAYLWLRKRVK